MSTWETRNKKSPTNKEVLDIFYVVYASTELSILLEVIYANLEGRQLRIIS